MRAKTAFLIVIVVLGLTACVRPAPSAAPTPTSPPASQGAPAPTEVPATATPAATPQPTMTPVPPTPTPAPVPRFTATPDVTTVPPTATPDPLIAVVKSASPPVVYDAYPSTDGRWVASVVQHHCTNAAGTEGFGYEFMRLINNWEGTERVVADQLFACGGLGAYGLSGLLWSPNNRYFYFTDAREGVPDGCGFWEQPLLRMEPESGQVERLGGGALSPDGARLATWSGSDLAVWDLNEGVLFRLPAAVGDALRGPIAWSPDGQVLVYLQVTALCPPTGPAVLTRVDVPAAAQEVLLVSDAPVFTDLGWEAAETITLTAGEERWQYDVAAGTLQQ